MRRSLRPVDPAPLYSHAAPAVHPPATAAVTAVPNPAVVRVIASDGDVKSMGSGTLVHVTDQFGLVLTNWHVVRGTTGSIAVVFPNGARSGATVMKLDEAWDLAALGIWKPNVRPVPIAAQAPRVGERLTIAGYGSGAYREGVGRCTQYVAPGESHPFEMLELSVQARQGDSGGPIFNARGELAGVLLGARTGATVGSYCGRVQMFLADVTDTLDAESHRAGNGQEMIARRVPGADERIARLSDVSATNRRKSLPAPADKPDASPPKQPPTEVDDLVKERNETAASPNALDRADVIAASSIAKPEPNDLPQAFDLPDIDDPPKTAAAAAIGIDDGNVEPLEFYRPLTGDTQPYLGGRSSVASLLPLRDDQVIRLTDIIGTTVGEQIKSALASVGVLTLLCFVLQLFFTSPAKRQPE